MANQTGRITRRQFIRRAGFGAAAAGSIAAGLGGAARAAPVTHDVYPTGQYPNDRLAIQNAINASNPGDTILLHATATPGGAFTPFNLGNAPSYPSSSYPFPATILIDRALSIQGEQPPGLPRTRINGGYGAFFINTLSGPVNFNTIDSHNATFYFLFYLASEGAEIRHVNVYDGRSVNPLGNPAYPAGIFDGIRFGLPGNFPAQFQIKSKVSGNVDISHCRFDNSGVMHLDGYSNGIYCHVVDMIAPDSEAYLSVSGCYLRNISGRSIEVYTWDKASITGNVIESTVAGRILNSSLGEFVRASHGVWIENAGDDRTIVEFNNNHIALYPMKYNDYNVALLPARLGEMASGASIGHNTIDAGIGDNKYVGVANCFYLRDSEGSIIRNNALCGDLQFGVQLVYCENCTVMGNDLSRLTSLNMQLLIVGGGGNQIIPDGSGVENKFGTIATPGVPAIYCNGSNDNLISHNDFTQTGLKGFKVSSSGISRAGCVFLDAGTSGNEIYVATSDLPPLEYPWYEPCTQIANGSYMPGLPYDMEDPNQPNKVYWTFDVPNFPGPCDSTQYYNLIKMLLLYSDLYKQYKDVL